MSHFILWFSFLALNTVEVLRKTSPLLSGKKVILPTILLGIFIAFLVSIVFFVRFRIAMEIKRREEADAKRGKKTHRR